MTTLFCCSGRPLYRNAFLYTTDVVVVLDLDVAADVLVEFGLNKATEAAVVLSVTVLRFIAIIEVIVD